MRDVWAHMRTVHNVNYDQQFILAGEYLRMKLVNFMRKSGRQPTALSELECELSLQPVIEDDRFLFEELNCEEGITLTQCIVQTSVQGSCIFREVGIYDDPAAACHVPVELAILYIQLGSLHERPSHRS